MLTLQMQLMIGLLVKHYFINIFFIRQEEVYRVYLRHTPSTYPITPGFEIVQAILHLIVTLLMTIHIDYMIALLEFIGLFILTNIKSSIVYKRDLTIGKFNEYLFLDNSIKTLHYLIYILLVIFLVKG